MELVINGTSTQTHVSSHQVTNGIHDNVQVTNGHHGNHLGQYPGHVCCDASEDDPLYMFKRVGRAVYIEVNLDLLIDNLRLLKAKCRNKEIGVIVVLKGDAYGHGVETVAKHIEQHSAADRIAVATVGEALQLRRASIKSPIHVLGNLQSWEMHTCLLNGLIPTVSCVETIVAMGDALKNMGNRRQTKTINKQLRSPPQGAIHIKVDTGMGRNGCLPQHLPSLVQACRDNKVPLEGIFSHICHHEDPEYSEDQLKLYEQLIEPYRDQGIFFHTSCSGPVLVDQGTTYDFIRPGVAIYGLAPISDLSAFADMGFRPALCIKGTPTLVKCHPKGSKVGYCCTYECKKDNEWIAAFPIGFGDGFWRALGQERGCIVRDKTGEKCPVIGRVSMDAITVRLPCQPDADETFTIITADFDPMTSVSGIAEAMDTITNEVLTRLAQRLPRVYKDSSGNVLSIKDALC